MVLHAALEGGRAETSGAAAVFAHSLRGLSELHLSYLRYWDHLLDLEEAACSPAKEALWAQSSSAKEAAQAASGRGPLRLPYH